ncbi:MAG: hypothetical protein UDF83_07375 [Collinsella stercoris]|nr:hypothetical protein [Collinsella stercoris]
MNGNTLNLIRASQVEHHRLKHGNDMHVKPDSGMHVKPDSGMHGKSDNDKHAEPDNDIYVEHCNDMHAEPGNDARTRFQGAASTDQIGPELYKKPGPHMRTGFSESKGVSE